MSSSNVSAADDSKDQRSCLTIRQLKEKIRHRPVTVEDEMVWADLSERQQIAAIQVLSEKYW